ncbi:MAG: MMPL family transporter, partial [Thermoleophilia bacterium]|nr:MMPL family transporter [Thermoleophilia bacterium]
QRRGVKEQLGRPLLNFAKDGKLAVLAVTIRATGEADNLQAAADRLRLLANSGRPPGLQARLTGGIGYSSDAVRIFNSLGGTVLIGTALVVIILLLLIYRSPILWLIPLITVGFAETVARAFGTVIADSGMIVNGQSATVMTVMVFGVGTDYALLLIARYREELRRHEDRHEAMRFALHRSVPAIVASASTVAAALIVLLLAVNNGTQSMGPIAAIGVITAMLAMLTLLPALLLIVGRRAFWPFVPRFRSTDDFAAGGFWSALGARIAANPRRVGLGMLSVMAVMALGWFSYSSSLSQANSYRDKVDSVTGTQLLAKSLPRGETAPTVVIVRGDDRRARLVIDTLRKDRQVVSVTGVQLRDKANGLARVQVTLKGDPYSATARQAIPRIRARLARVAPGAALIGGPTAIDYDSRVASARDMKLLIPVALVLVLLILIALLRAVALPLMLMASVVASFVASLGASYWLFGHVFNFPGADPGLPLYVFIFLVALGVDYNIFLMARVREETLAVGTREGMSRGLVATGGVITSAGLVLAGTFSIMASLPLVFIAEIGIAVAFGVLFDALLVRSVLVPAMVWDTGSDVWWPSSLRRRI